MPNPNPEPPSAKLPVPQPASPELLFRQLQEHLLRVGIAPRHVRRYITELTDHLADLTAEHQRAGLPPAAAQSAALLRLGSLDDLTAAMLAQPRLQSLSARAPWATFTLAPLLSLATLWFLSLCLLRLGWHLFMPGASTPFGTAFGRHNIFNPRNIYFQLDRALYLGAPILVGWCMVLTATRQRLKAIWPLVSLALLAVLAATSHVQANRLAVPSGLGHIRVDFALRPAAQNEYALVVFLFALLPYLLWRLKTALSLPA